MRKLWTITKREYLERVRSRWFVIATIFGPLLFGGIMFLPAFFAMRTRASVNVARIQVIDATGTTLGSRVAAELGGGPMGDTTLSRVVRTEPAGLAEAESLATKAVLDREIVGYLVLDGSALEGRFVRYAGTNATALTDMRRIETAVRREILAERLQAAGVSGEDARSIARLNPTVRSERLTPTGRGGSGRVNLLFAVTVAMLLYTTIFIYGQNVL
ncbi:MAG TPA: hypothetical protein VFX50_14510, partial [Gemmatimonadales bacterium]|nr:hypothetical protein [Gemmatimonadales bacterium]